MYVGCPQWSNPQWRQQFFDPNSDASALYQYAQHFNTVEGNTTFYATPNAATITKWRTDVPDTFRFCFKLPHAFTHQQALNVTIQDLNDWCHLFSPLFEVMGPLLIGLPKQFSPHDLPALVAFLKRLPSELDVAIEVRHRAFFEKGDAERDFNRTLMANGWQRSVMDTRALFAHPATTEALVDAQKKKPHLPVHAIATADAPVLRFVVGAMSEQDTILKMFTPWVGQLQRWVEDGKTPYVFFHTADNHGAPQLAQQLISMVDETHPVAGPFPHALAVKQNQLF